jgi:hypothetical protein
VDLFSSAGGYERNIAVSDGSGQYLSGGSLIATSYEETRLDAGAGEIGVAGLDNHNSFWL